MILTRLLTMIFFFLSVFSAKIDTLAWDRLLYAVCCMGSDVVFTNRCTHAATLAPLLFLNYFVVPAFRVNRGGLILLNFPVGRRVWLHVKEWRCHANCMVTVNMKEPVIRTLSYKLPFTHGKRLEYELKRCIILFRSTIIYLTFFFSLSGYGYARNFSCFAVHFIEKCGFLMNVDKTDRNFCQPWT